MDQIPGKGLCMKSDFIFRRSESAALSDTCRLNILYVIILILNQENLPSMSKDNENALGG